MGEEWVVFRDAALEWLYNYFKSKIGDEAAYRKKDAKELFELYSPLIKNDEDVLDLPRSKATNLKSHIALKNNWIGSLERFAKEIILVDGDASPEANRIKILINEMRNSPANPENRVLEILSDRCIAIFRLWALKKEAEEISG